MTGPDRVMVRKVDLDLALAQLPQVTHEDQAIM